MVNIIKNRTRCMLTGEVIKEGDEVVFFTTFRPLALRIALKSAVTLPIVQCKMNPAQCCAKSEDAPIEDSGMSEDSPSAEDTAMSNTKETSTSQPKKKASQKKNT